MKKIITLIIIGCCCGQTIAQPNIIAAEYFIDSDPGLGNATPITLTTPSNNISNQAFSVAIGALPQGVHSLFVRSRDAGGKWSVTNRHVFYKPAASSGLPPSNIVKAEYFFDIDPGFGNATNIPLTAGIDVQNINFAANLSPLSPGVHNLFVRSRSAEGKWSVSNRHVFYKPEPGSGLPPADITHIEYFIDNDPGFKNAIPVAINSAPNFSDFIMPINISGLSTGNHRLFMRSRSSKGWSVTNEYIFPIAATASSPFINVNAITKTVMCARDSVKVSYHATGTFNPGNIFNVELSDPAGSFSSPVIIGSYTGINSAIIPSRIPPNTLGGSNFKVRVSSTNPVVTGLTGTDVLTIGNWPYLGLDTTVYHFCPGETTNLNTLYNTTGLTAIWNTGSPTIAIPGIYTLIVTNSFGCKDTAAANIVLEVATWTGATSSNWHIASNWNIGKVPTDKTHVIVPGGTANICVVSTANGQAASIQARIGATIQFTNNRVVVVKGNCATLPPN